MVQTSRNFSGQSVETTKPSVSVIIPVYNAEKYLKRCYRSLAAQSFQNAEFLFIDDASRDRSAELIADFARRDPRVHLLRNRENLGQGRTRDAGIDAASGDFLFFLDADDWLASDAIRITLTEACRENADLVIFGVHHIYRFFDRNYPSYSRQIVPSGRELLIPFLLGFHSHSPLQNPEGFVYNKLIRRELIQQHSLRHGFPGRNLGEDGLFVSRLLFHAGKVVFLPDIFYFYERRNAGSVTASRNMELFLTQLDTSAAMRDFLSAADEWSSSNWERFFRESVCRRLYFEFMNRLHWRDDSANRTLFRRVAERMEQLHLKWDVDCGHAGYNRFRDAMRCAVDDNTNMTGFRSATTPLKQLKFKTLFVPPWVATFKHAIERFLQ